MFVHGLWSETDASFADLADRAGALLRVPVSFSTQHSAELMVTVQYGQNADVDAGWSRPAADPPDEIRPVRLYEAGSVIGIVSADPGINFRLRGEFAEHSGSRPLALHWSRDLLSGVSDRSDWQLYGLRLLHPGTQTEVVIQGGRQDSGGLLGEADRLDGYEVTGVSVADSVGRMVTVYDEGQIWLQQISADAVAGLIDSVVLPLFGGRFA